VRSACIAAPLSPDWCAGDLQAKVYTPIGSQPESPRISLTLSILNSLVPLWESDRARRGSCRFRGPGRALKSPDYLQNSTPEYINPRSRLGTRSIAYLRPQHRVSATLNGRFHQLERHLHKIVDVRAGSPSCARLCVERMSQLIMFLHVSGTNRLPGPLPGW
jgi:hypothetical protein